MSKRQIADELVNQVASSIGEQPGTQAWWSIRFLLKRYGSPKVSKMVDEAVEIDRNGGLFTNDGARRRTLGGIFFHLAKDELGPRDRHGMAAYVARKMGTELESAAAAEEPPG
jgi:hypothetical protein